VSGNPPVTRDETNERFARYREDVLRVVYMGVPIGVLQGLVGRVTASILSQPWQALLLMIPVAAVGWLMLRGIVTRRQVALDWRFLAFLGTYILFFSIAAQTRLLDWQRDPTVFGEPPGGGAWLTPVSWGDWRYKLVPKVRGDDLVVVLREPAPGRSAEIARTELIELIGMAAANGAKAVALDYYFAAESRVDATLCTVIAAARIPVIVGYGFERFQGRIQAQPVPKTLQPCMTPQVSAHLVGLLDADHVARMTPLFFNNDADRPALSLMAARAMAGPAALPLPSNGQLRFVEPAEPHTRVRLDDLRTDQQARNSLRDKLMLVGEESDIDRFTTPFGSKPGAEVHADAVHSLLHSHYIRDVPWFVSLLLILGFCYWLAVWCAAGASVAKLAIAAGIATACFVAVAIGGILTGPYWFDVAYSATAVWLLLPLLLGLRRVLRRSGAANDPGLAPSGA
jgi:CHASE2 domain-containing sensor protein